MNCSLQLTPVHILFVYRFIDLLIYLISLPVAVYKSDWNTIVCEQLLQVKNQGQYTVGNNSNINLCPFQRTKDYLLF